MCSNVVMRFMISLCPCTNVSLDRNVIYTCMVSVLFFFNVHVCLWFYKSQSICLSGQCKDKERWRVSGNSLIFIFISSFTLLAFLKCNLHFTTAFFFSFSTESQSIPTPLNSSRIAYIGKYSIVHFISLIVSLLCSRKEPRFGYHYWITSPTKQE